MTGSLVFADGVRLATREEIPGPLAQREIDWARVEAARIDPGFTLRAAHGEAFRYYAEANVHAQDIWSVFEDLCRALLDERGELLISFKDDEPQHVFSGPVAAMLDAFRPHADQLAHDGYIQFGIICSDDVAISEVLVAPTKHLKIWFNDERAFARQMRAHRLDRVESLQFLDEYPRITTRLPADRALPAEDLERAILGRLSGLR